MKKTLALLLLLPAAVAWGADAYIEPGSVYREYRITMDGNDWRVTDPDVAYDSGIR